jgi:hypothetical protein
MAAMPPHSPLAWTGCPLACDKSVATPTTPSHGRIPRVEIAALRGSRIEAKSEEITRRDRAVLEGFVCGSVGLPPEGTLCGGASCRGHTGACTARLRGFRSAGEAQVGRVWGSFTVGGRGHGGDCSRGVRSLQGFPHSVACSSVEACDTHRSERTPSVSCHSLPCRPSVAPLRAAESQTTDSRAARPKMRRE